MRRLFLSLLVAIPAMSAAKAGDLPAGAVALSSDEVTKIYSGKTAFWKSATIYFASDGTIKGYYGAPPKGALIGTWSVNGNEGCMKSHDVHDDVSKETTDCNKYWKSGKTVWQLWSVHFNNSPVDPHGYYDKSLSAFRPGDQIEKEYRKFGGS